MTSQEFQNQLDALTPALRSFSFNFVRTSDDADDLVQETLLKALMNQNKFREDVNFRAWLFRIMRNTFINQYKRSKKVRYDLDMTNEAEPATRLPDLNTTTPEQLTSINEIKGAIATVKDELRIPFELFIKGFKYREIAESLAMPIGTIKNKIFLARQELHNKLSDYNYTSC